MTQPPSDPLFNQRIDLGSGQQFSINDFLGSLEKHTEKMLAEAANARAALEQAGGEATVGAVTVGVDAAGTLTSVAFSDQLSTTSTSSLNNQFLQAHRLAIREANRSLAGWVGGGIGAAIAQAAPAVTDERFERMDERKQEEQPLAPAPTAEPEALRLDPASEQWMSILDTEDDLPTALQKMMDTAPFPLPDLEGKTGAEIDAEFAAENQRTSDALMSASQEIQAIVATATSKELDVAVTAAGAVSELSFHAAALSTDPAELADRVKSVIAEASAQAAVQVRALLSEVSSTDIDDINLFTPTQFRN